MSKKKYSLIEVASIVENEGLVYAVMHYMDETYIEDAELASYWKAAREALEAIKTRLGGIE